MADAITSFFLLPQANRVTGSPTAARAPSALELGADNLTYNPRREALGRLFTSPSSASTLKNLDSFLSLHAASSSSAPAPRAGGKDALKPAAPELKKNDSAALDVFIKRETSAEARLKELLAGTSAPAASAAKPAAEEAAVAAPAITRNTGLRVNEGGEGTISNLRLNTSFAGARPQDIVYTVNDGPRSGQLELTSKPGKAVTTFTQQDLNLGRVRYVNNGAETRGDSFDFTVTAGDEELSGSFGISIAPVNDTPTVAVNEGLTLGEGATATLSTAQLSVSDPDNNASDTVFTVTEGPQHGRLEFDDNAGVSVTSFTQADIASGRVRYVSDGSENTTDSFKFTASDGSASSSEETFAITLNPVDDAPVPAFNAGATVTEGGTATLTSAQLNTGDVDTAPEDLVYTVTSAPAAGRLEFSDAAGTAITSFTQADVNAGRVRYVSDGSEAITDNFTFTVSDATTGLPAANFNFTINPVDDAPVAATNTGATVAEGGAAGITSAQLNTTDADTAAGGIRYTITQGPQHGRLEFTDNPGGTVASFTQADVDSGRLRYIHDGSETTSDSFGFTTADANTTLAAATFGITVDPVDDASALAANAGATVAEGGAVTIGAAQLSASDVDTDAGDLTYTVTAGPANGHLEFSDAAGVAIDSLTQADIDAGRLRYVNDGTENSSDKFTFSLSDGTTVLAAQDFNIGVTPVNDAPVLQANAGATTTEGGTTTITSAGLRVGDADTAAQNISYTVTSATAHGRLELSSNAGHAVTSFTQADIDAGRLRYVHNGSETTTDSFTFTASDGQYSTAPTTFALSATPVNDPPVLARNTGATVNEGGTRTISQNQLRVTDVDTGNDNLVYSVTTAPGNGRLELNTNPGVAVTSFTQADITAGRVRFVHDGSETTSASFGFSVSDGNTTLGGNTFNFTVNPVNDRPIVTKNTGATLNRGTSTIINSTKLQSTDVDNPSSGLTYTVTRATTRGRLELTTNPGQAITSFTQADLDAGSVRYVHTSFLSGTDDSFRFRVSDGSAATSIQTFNINVN
jgi:VCBS repeat-containing protein